MKNTVILSLSDFHIGCNIKNDIDDVVTSFVEKLKFHTEYEKGWKPDFICISGDIAWQGKKDEFNKAKEIVEKLCKVCKINSDNVILAPGNHDMTIQEKPIPIIDESGKDWEKMGDDEKKTVRDQRDRYTEYIKSYIEHVNLFLENPSIITNNRKNNGVKKNIIPVFENYSIFRESFVSDKIRYEQCDFLENTGLKFINGYKCFKQERVLFWELNNTWMSLPYDENAHRIYNMKFGYCFVNLFRTAIENLKKEGYFIVTVFHQPLRFLSHDEYQPSGGNFCVFDTIVNLSDMCLSGHEHGPETKKPDCLANSTQYFLNGGFYAWEGKKLDCSAALIRIDRENNIIQKKQLDYDVRKFDWKFSKFSEVPIASSFYQKKNAINNLTFEFGYKKIEIKTNASEVLHSKIISQYFGDKFVLSPDGNFLRKNGDEQNIYKVCFIDIQRVKLMNLEIAMDETHPTLVLCYAPLEMFPKAEKIYLNLKNKYVFEYLHGHLLFVMLQVEKY